MSQFEGKWAKNDDRNLGTRIVDVARARGPLKPRLEQAVRQIQIQMGRLDSSVNKLKGRDEKIFSKVVQAVQNHDTMYATVYANELAEVRKMCKMVTRAKLAMEQMVLRLSTVQDLGDIVVTLAPAMSIIKNIRSGLAGIVPEAENEMSEINGLLNGILVEAGQVGGYSLDVEAANEDAERVLAEASAVAERSISEKFPELPSEILENASVSTEDYA